MTPLLEMSHQLMRYLFLGLANGAANAQPGIHIPGVRPNMRRLPAVTFPYTLHHGFQQKLLGATKVGVSIAHPLVAASYGHVTINRQEVDYRMFGATIILGLTQLPHCAVS